MKNKYQNIKTIPNKEKLFEVTSKWIEYSFTHPISCPTSMNSYELQLTETPQLKEEKALSTPDPWILHLHAILD